MDRFTAVTQSVKERRKVQDNKTATLEKGDFIALIAAAWETLGKTALLTMGFFVAVAFIILMIWGH